MSSNFGCHIVGSSGDLSKANIAYRLCQTKINQYRVPVIGQNDVGWLQVKVQDATFVDCLNSLTDVLDNRFGQSLTEWYLQFAQWLPGNIFED